MTQTAGTQPTGHQSSNAPSSGAVPEAAPASPAVAAGAALPRSLTTPKIVFLVMAAIAPMSGIVGSTPLAFAIGDGAGVPATFVIAGLILLCFAVGYAAISRHVSSAGGFATYLGRALGRPAAVAAGFVAVIAYNSASAGCAGALGYFANLIGSAHHVHLPWTVWTAAALLIMAFMGYRRIDLSARVLAVLMVSESVILLLLTAAVVARRGAAAFPLESFEPRIVFAPGLGVALMFALISFVGFEIAALYGQEARDSRRSVPVATYCSVALITVFFALVSWAGVGAVGAGKVVGAANAQFGNLYFNLSDRYLDGAVTNIMQALLCTSLFGAMLGLHTVANRYLYTLGRERVLPRAVARIHPRHASPYRASLMNTIAIAVVCSAFAAARAQPYTNLATTMLALGTVGIVGLQAAVAICVPVYFRGKPDRHWWRTFTAPVLATVGLVGTMYLLLSKFRIVTGTANPVINALPWLFVAATIVGFGTAIHISRHDSSRYRAIAADPE